MPDAREALREKVAQTLIRARLTPLLGLVTVTDALLPLFADVWYEGFDAGEQDYAAHETFDEPCTPNPYRKGDPS